MIVDAEVKLSFQESFKIAFQISFWLQVSLKKQVFQPLSIPLPLEKSRAKTVPHHEITVQIKKLTKGRPVAPVSA